MLLVTIKHLSFEMFPIYKTQLSQQSLVSYSQETKKIEIIESNELIKIMVLYQRVTFITLYTDVKYDQTLLSEIQHMYV